MPDQSYLNELRQGLLEAIRQQNVTHDVRLLDAFSTVPRHLFLPDETPDRAYQNISVDLKYNRAGRAVSTSIQPAMLASALDQLQLAPGHNVLEIGTANGYAAALIQTLVGPSGHVTTVEIDRDLAEQSLLNLQAAGFSQVNVVNADGVPGYAPRAAYDRIISAAGIMDIPPNWISQLKPGGRLVLPIWLDGVQVSAAFEVQPDGCLYSDNNRPSAFVYLRGAEESGHIGKQVGSKSLYLLADDVDQIDTAALHLLFSDDHELLYLESVMESTDYWYGFQLYLMLNEPAGCIFAVYAVAEGQQAYGLEGRGIMLLAPGSAVFAPYEASGLLHCYAGSDASLLLQEALDDWNAAGRPSMQDLRVRLIPKTASQPEVKRGKIYVRSNHYLHVWLEART